MYQIHTLETAPEKSQQSLQGLKNSFGLIPNLAATMAESPTLINGFVGGFMNFHGGAFGTGERQVLLLTNAVTNNCSWAVAFHSTMALKEGIDPEAVRTIRGGELPKDPKLAALSRLTRVLIEKRGHLDEADVNLFLTAGFSKAQVFDVVAGLAVSVMANYAGNIAKPALEEPFKDQQWNG